MQNKETKKLNIAMVTDYFYPSIGGIESHVRTIAEELVMLGHKVIIITHKYPNFSGCHKIGKLDVYYLDIPVLASNTTIPTLLCTFLLYKEIFKKNSIDIVHGHQSMSSMCLEGIYHGKILGCKTVMTDHSVFEFSKFERIICNVLTRFICANIDRIICVSKIGMINTQQRTKVDSSKFIIIPNGINSEVFYPKKKMNNKHINLLYSCRLVFRKGIDLFIASLPYICKDERIRVTVIGDGPKREEIEQFIDENQLHEKVKLIGEKSQAEIPDLLRGGDIFLNTSLTETFCIAIIEAAACGLQVVTTNVGGIHEVLPKDAVLFCEPNGKDIAEQVFNAANNIENFNSYKNYQFIKEKYNWREIAFRTKNVYTEIEKKNICFADVYSQLKNRSKFLFRFLAWFEYTQIKIEDWISNF